MEIWKDIVDYEDLYQVSNKGNVRRKIKDGYRMLKPTDGVYLSVDLSKYSESHRQNIHRLVALHFIPNPRHVNCVNHKDGNKHNNNVENLEWISDRENIIHAGNVMGTGAFGKKARPVNQYDTDGNLIRKFDSVAQASNSLNIPYARANITCCCQGKTTSAYGYRWEYVD